MQEHLAEERQKVVELESSQADELSDRMGKSQQEIQTLNKVSHTILMLILENHRRRRTINICSKGIPYRERATSRDGRRAQTSLRNS